MSGPKGEPGLKGQKGEAVVLKEGVSTIINVLFIW